MIDDLTLPKAIAFIQNHLNEDPAELMLKAHKYSDLPLKFIVEQISSRQKAKTKLPEWYANSKLIFPPKQNLEQASSQRTAEFKAGLLSGKNFVDLTGGSGIDCYYIAQKFKSATYVEPDSNLCEIAVYNFCELKKSIQIENLTAEEYLKQTKTIHDWIFIDPSRRDKLKNRLFALDDCVPNVLKIKDELLAKGKRVLIKASPMLDIKKTLYEFPECYLVQIVAVNNDVKELLFYIEVDNKSEPKIEAWNLFKDCCDESMSFFYSEEEQLSANIGDIELYLYEPNSAIMKSGAFNSLTNMFNIHKLHVNTHLYSSKKLIPDFPGKVLKVIDVFSATKKEMKKRIKSGKINVISRNFPLGANELKKKFKLQDGGEQFLLFCDTEHQGFKAILCSNASES